MTSCRGSIPPCRDDLDVDNGAGEAFGSKTTIDDATIGAEMRFTGDNGRDTINMTDSRVVQVATFALGDGGSDVNFINAVFAGDFSLSADAGNDEIRLERTTVEGDTSISVGAGQDTVELVLATKLLGSTDLFGGDGIDTLTRQVAAGQQCGHHRVHGQRGLRARHVHRQLG